MHFHTFIQNQITRTEIRQEKFPRRAYVVRKVKTLEVAALSCGKTGMEKDHDPGATDKTTERDVLDEHVALNPLHSSLLELSL